MPRPFLAALCALLALLTAAVIAAPTDTPNDLRGDEGVLMEIRPSGAVFLAPDRILVTDSKYNQFHIFDPEGRRYRRLDMPRTLPEAAFNGIAELEEGVYFVNGSYYHVKNNPRFVHPRSVVYQFDIQGEAIGEKSAEVNYSPDRALRKTGYYGQMVASPLEMGGIAIDSKQKRMFFGLARPYGETGEILIYEARLPEVLEQKKDLEFKDVKTKLVPEKEPALGEKFRLADLAYVQGKGLLVLLSSESADGKRFGSNQLWILKGGFGPAKLVAKEIAPGNRGTGLAVREEKKNFYSVALTFDNNPEETNTPSRIMVMKGVKL